MQSHKASISIRVAFAAFDSLLLPIYQSPRGSQSQEKSGNGMLTNDVCDVSTQDVLHMGHFSCRQKRSTIFVAS